VLHNWQRNQWPASRSASAHVDGGTGSNDPISRWMSAGPDAPYSKSDLYAAITLLLRLDPRSEGEEEDIPRCLSLRSGAGVAVCS
jgi:hypothetical protein